MYENIKNLPYINIPVTGGLRHVFILPFYSQNEWKTWIVDYKKRNEENNLIGLDGTSLIRGEYIAEHPADDKDCYVDFVDNLYRYFVGHNTEHSIKMLVEYCKNIGACLGKIHCIYKSNDSEFVIDSGSYVWTEIESLMVFARSIFDYLQDILSTILVSVQWNDGHKSKELPNKFSKMVRHGEKLLTAEELEEKYKLYRPIVDCYIKHSKFFTYLRDFRNKIVHNFCEPQIVFYTDRGFCVASTKEPFNSFNWQKSMHYNSNLVFLIPWITWIIENVYAACNDFTNIMIKSIAMEPIYTDKYRVFNRSFIANGIADIARVTQGDFFENI